jgi:hypothetical protein
LILPEAAGIQQTRACPFDWFFRRRFPGFFGRGEVALSAIIPYYQLVSRYFLPFSGLHCVAIR